MPHSSEQAILQRHHNSLHGTLHVRRVASEALGLRKPYYVYEPPGLESASQVPILYLFRGHQREWINFREDPSRQQSTALEDLDTLIARSHLPPVIAVMPGLSSSNNHVPALGIDMVGTWSESLQGLGTGRFWQFLTHELIPTIDATYPQAQEGLRLMAGFSLGGYTVSLLALHLPGYFHYAAAYDALFMWTNHQDPRAYEDGSHTDRVWTRRPIFDPAFGNPRDEAALHRWNPTDTLANADEATLQALRQTAFWIKSADADDQYGNRDRCQYFVDLLREKGLSVLSGKVVLAPGAAHTWQWTDLFLMRFLEHLFACPEPAPMLIPPTPLAL